MDKKYNGSQWELFSSQNSSKYLLLWKREMHKVWNDMRVGRKPIYISQTAQQVQTQNANLQIFNNVTTFLKMYVSLLLFRVIYKLLASKSESIRVQALKVLGYFMKHLGHKWVLIIKTFVWRPVYEHTKLYLVCWHAKNLGWVIPTVRLIVMLSFFISISWAYAVHISESLVHYKNSLFDYNILGVQRYRMDRNDLATCTCPFSKGREHI